MKITLVDKNDVVIGAKERDEVRTPDIYRVASLWVTNSDGQVLFVKRALSKKKSPGLWASAVNGTVEENETYLSNILKETEEEIGIKLTEKDIKVSRKVFEQGHDYTFFAQIYTTRLDLRVDELAPDPREIDEMRWFSKEEVLAKYENHPEEFVKAFRLMLYLLD